MGRKCTKYNFVAPLSFTNCYSLGLDQKFCSSFNLRLDHKIRKWNFIESSSLRFDLTSLMSGFGYSCNSGLKQKRPKWNLTESLTRGSTKHFASKTLLKVKLYWFSLWHKNQTFSKLSSCYLCVLVLDITLKSLFSSYTGKNHNPVSLLAWNCFMTIIVYVFITDYQCIMVTCPK